MLSMEFLAFHFELGEFALDDVGDRFTDFLLEKQN